MNKVSIVIPIYKSIPNHYELISINQCLKVLFKHSFTIVTFEELDMAFNIQLFENAKVEYEIEYFDRSYFEDVSGYNQLMLSLNFYLRFTRFDYILIYQLDAYVFRDELDYWCDQGYDYIGAPWFMNWNYPNFSIDDLWVVGNGGFSLRKINKFINILSSRLPILKPKKIFEIYYNRDLFSFFVSLGKCLGIKNKIEDVLEQYSLENEDIFYCIILKDTACALRIPEIEVAIRFAFEVLPKLLFEKNNNQLPFGCHAWKQFDYDCLWSNYIQLNK